MPKVHNWPLLGAVFVWVGFKVFIFAMETTTGSKMLAKEAATEGLVVTAFIVYLVAFALMVFMHFGGFESNKVPNILVTAAAFLAGGLILIALIVYGVRSNSDRAPVYPTTLFVSGALLAIGGGVVNLLTMLGVLT